jgi:UDP-N-acetylglucosamine--N-acetylmuramyl-(pentapeptide) pyrophosphoryl-undecaprenol N-acetylglucosamine transferase
VVYVGSSSGLEREVVEMKDMFLFPTVGWVNKNIKGKIISFLRFIPGFFVSIWIIYRKRACAIFHTGSFASIPVGMAGAMMRIPIFTLVLDSKPGKAVNLLSRFSKEIFLPYEGEFFSLGDKKKVVTGIPVRENLIHGNYEDAIDYFSLERNKKTLLVIGGSRGAKFLAGLSEQLIPLMKENWQFIIQRGDFEINIPYEFVKQFAFIDRMDLAYALSDVILSRSGAMTTAEIENLGIPAILIPYPFAFKDHQFFNAKRLAFKRNNIIILREKEVKLKEFPELVEKLYGKKKSAKRNTAAENIAERILGYVRAV